MKTGPKQCDYCIVQLPLTQDYGYLGLPGSQKISARTGSLGQGVTLYPLRFPAEQCKVWAGSLMPALLPSPHQCKRTKGCVQPCADCSQIITTQLTFSACTRSPPLDLRCLPSHLLDSLLSAYTLLPSSSSSKVLNAWKKTTEKAFPLPKY